MALGIITIIGFVVLAGLDRLHRALEPVLWHSWDVVRRGTTPKFETRERQLVAALGAMLDVGHEAQAAHTRGEPGRPRRLVAALAAQLREWQAAVGQHLLYSLGWWAMVRVHVEVRPFPEERLRHTALRGIFSIETLLLCVLPAGPRVRLRMRALRYALDTLWYIFTTLQPPPSPARPWVDLTAAVDDLDVLGHEALLSARTLLLSVSAPEAEAAGRRARFERR